MEYLQEIGKPCHITNEVKIADIEKSIDLATTTVVTTPVVRMPDELFFAERDFRSSNLRSIIGHIVGDATNLGKSLWQMSRERTKQFEPVLCEDF